MSVVHIRQLVFWSAVEDASNVAKRRIIPLIRNKESGSDKTISAIPALRCVRFLYVYQNRRDHEWLGKIEPNHTHTRKGHGEEFPPEAAEKGPRQGKHVIYFTWDVSAYGIFSVGDNILPCFSHAFFSLSPVLPELRPGSRAKRSRFPIIFQYPAKKSRFSHQTKLILTMPQVASGGYSL
jgi:hypothetical protein